MRARRAAGAGHAAAGSRSACGSGFAGDDFGYAIDLGLPVPPAGAFAARSGDQARVRLGRRRAAALGACSSTGAARWCGRARRRASGRSLTTQLPTFDSMMTHCADPRHTPELLMLREQMRGLALLRSLPHRRRRAPARQPQIGTHTPVLATTARDLAAALQTIREIGDARGARRRGRRCLSRRARSVSTAHDGWFELEMRQHGLLRPLRAAELSDGTLRYLLWVAALLTPRPPALMVLNEPETSLHPDLLPALGRLIARAAERVAGRGGLACAAR